jgi:hypothetical protein
MTISPAWTLLRFLETENQPRRSRFNRCCAMRPSG